MLGSIFALFQLRFGSPPIPVDRFQTLQLLLEDDLSLLVVKPKKRAKKELTSRTKADAEFWSLFSAGSLRAAYFTLVVLATIHIQILTSAAVT